MGGAQNSKWDTGLSKHFTFRLFHCVHFAKSAPSNQGQHTHLPNLELERMRTDFSASLRIEGKGHLLGWMGWVNPSCHLLWQQGWNSSWWTAAFSAFVVRRSPSLREVHQLISTSRKSKNHLAGSSEFPPDSESRGHPGRSLAVKYTYLPVMRVTTWVTGSGV